MDKRALPEWLSATNAGELVAMLALLVKAFQLFLGGLDDSTEYEKTVEYKVLGALSVALLFLSLVILLRQVSQQLQSVKRLSKQVADIADELERRDHAGRYGMGAAAVASLLDLAGRHGKYAHGQVGGRILSYLLLDVFTKAASDLSRLTRGDEDSMELKEYHVVDKFVHDLIDCLPVGSAWIGISRLQSVDAWNEQTAHVDFHEFQKAVEKRCRRSEINYLRLWCFDEDRHRAEMTGILQAQSEAGLIQRWFISNDSIADFSIMWVPTRKLTERKQIHNLESPIDEWDGDGDLEPLCGILFGTRGGRELEGMTIYSAASPEFRRLCHEWQTNWQQASTV
jgi:hypothetical protein